MKAVPFEKGFSVLLLMVALSPTACAQSQRLQGRVVDGFHRKGLAGVEVKLDEAGTVAKTNDEGRFQMRLPKDFAGRLTLSFDRSGWMPRKLVTESHGREPVSIGTVALVPPPGLYAGNTPIQPATFSYSKAGMVGLKIPAYYDGDYCTTGAPVIVMLKPGEKLHWVPRHMTTLGENVFAADAKLIAFALRGNNCFVQYLGGRGKGQLVELQMTALVDSLTVGSIEPIQQKVQAFRVEVTPPPGEYAFFQGGGNALDNEVHPVADLGFWHLRLIDAVALSDAVKSLEDPDPGVRRKGARTLVACGVAALPEIRRAMANRDPEVRATAVDALLVMHEEAADAVPELITCLSDSSGRVRHSACMALSGIGPKAARAADALVKALDDPSSDVRSAAVFALGELGPSAGNGAESLCRQLTTTDALKRIPAIESLGKLGAAAAPCVPALIPGLRDQNFSVRAATATTLGKIGPKAQPAIPDLLSMLKDQEAMVRQCSALALGDIGTASGEVVEALTRALDDGSIQVNVAQSLGELGPAAAPALTRLASLAAAAPDVDARVIYIRAIARIDAAEGRKWGPTLRSLLGSESGYERARAASALVDLEPESRAEIIPVLEQLAATDRSFGRDIAKETLERLRKAR